MVYKSPKELELIEKLGTVVDSLNYELRDVEVRPGQPALVRVTIDIKDRSRGVNLDDCYEVHNVLGPLFDVMDPLEAAYTLEVSSPGEKAPLRSQIHFEEAIGEEIEFKTRTALAVAASPTAAPRRNWRGKLLSVLSSSSGDSSGDSSGEEASEKTQTKITLEDALGTHTVDAQLIEGARWLRNWTRKVEPINKRKGKAIQSK